MHIAIAITTTKVIFTKANLKMVEKYLKKNRNLKMVGFLLRVSWPPPPPSFSLERFRPILKNIKKYSIDILYKTVTLIYSKQ